MVPTCDGCGQSAQDGQLWSGVAIRKGETVQGHYACVVKRLGPERILKAIQKGLLPFLDPAGLVEGRTPKQAAKVAATVTPTIEE